MEKHIEASIRKFGETRKQGQYEESTIKTYVSNIVNLHNMCCGDVPFEDLEWLKDHESVESKLGDNTSTRRNYMNACVIALHSQDPVNQGLLKLYEMKRAVLNNDTQIKKTGGLTQSQLSVVEKVSKDDLVKFIDSIHLAEHLDNHNEFMNGLVFKIHKEFPFRNELAEMKFIKVREYYKLLPEVETDMNWCVISKNACKFVLNIYKTSKTYGKKTLDIPPPLSAYIFAWLLKVRNIAVKDINYSPFLSWKNGNPINRNQLTHKLSDYSKKHLGVSIGTTLLAKYFSPEIDTSKRTTTSDLFELEKKINIRGHSLETNLTHYQIQDPENK